ncbi:MAG TPA: phosphotransferase [Chloroflexia bacterium]|nr:phosphotransferase [Chloroflexia bacterium]
MIQFDALSKRGQVGRLRRMAEKALLDYGINGARLNLLDHFNNTTFRVDAPSGERYVMRIHHTSPSQAYPGRTEVEVRSEMMWLDALRRDTGLGVPEPVRATGGAFLTIAQVDGVPEPRMCVLLKWLDGRFIDKGLTASHLERVGVFIARLHEHTTYYRVPEGFTRVRVDEISDVLAEYMLSKFGQFRSPEEVGVVKETISRVREVQARLGTGPEVFGLIHSDLHQENYLFHRGQVRAIDFDDCGWAALIYDLTVTLSEVKHRKDYPALRAALLQGYRNIRHLSAEHESYLNTYLALRELQLMIWFVDQREHPAFRDYWEADVASGLERLKEFVAV